MEVKTPRKEMKGLAVTGSCSEPGFPEGGREGGDAKRGECWEQDSELRCRPSWGTEGLEERDRVWDSRVKTARRE